jgi:hypothetical protein
MTAQIRKLVPTLVHLIQERFMGNETEKNFQHQQTDPTGTVDPSKRNPSQQGGQNPNQQDPSKKNPSQGDDQRQRENENVEKRRAS